MANDQSIDKAQRKLISVVYRFFDLMNKLSSTMTAVKLPIKKDMENQRLQNNYQKSLRKVKLILTSVDSIFGTDLTDIQLISKCSKVSDFCCVLTFTVNTVGEFHGKIMNQKKSGLNNAANSIMKKILDETDIEMCCIDNDGKPAIARTETHQNFA